MVMAKALEAVIFDLDGTVILNEEQWEDAFRAVMEEHAISYNLGMKLPNGWFHEPGIGISSNWKRYILDPVLVEKYTVETLKKYWLVNSEISKDIHVREGVVELFEKSREMGRQIALCTGSSWNVVEKELEQLELYLAFDVTTTGEEVLVQKPDPEIYLLTAQKLGVEPEECIVIEDSVAGVRAAIEAGCQAIGLVSDYAPEELLKVAGATYVVSELKELLTEGYMTS